MRGSEHILLAKLRAEHGRGDEMVVDLKEALGRSVGVKLHVSSTDNHLCSSDCQIALYSLLRTLRRHS